MTIKNVRTALLRAPLKNPFVTSLRRVEVLEDLVVIVECDDGTVGYGEGAPTPVITGETIGSMIAAIELIKPFLIGRTYLCSSLTSRRTEDGHLSGHPTLLPGSR